MKLRLPRVPISSKTLQFRQNAIVNVLVMATEWPGKSAILQRRGLRFAVKIIILTCIRIFLLLLPNFVLKIHNAKYTMLLRTVESKMKHTCRMCVLHYCEKATLSWRNVINEVERKPGSLIHVHVQFFVTCAITLYQIPYTCTCTYMYIQNNSGTILAHP